MDDVIFIGIAGGSGSGKGFLAEQLQQKLGCEVLQVDSYYKDLAHLNTEERARVNFDDPEAVDHLLLVDHIKRLRAGLSVDVPSYDFATHTRTGKTNRITPASRVIVVEGLFTLYWFEVREQLELNVFIELDEDVRLERRIARDVAERSRTRESVESVFTQTVTPMHEKYVQPTSSYADLVIRGDDPIDRSVKAVTDLLITSRQ